MSPLDISIEDSLAKIRSEIQILQSALKKDVTTVPLSCLDKIICLQKRADDLQILLQGSKNTEAQLICDATKTFCSAAVKEISKTGCSKPASKKLCKTKRKAPCKVCKLFNSFYELFK